MHRSQPSMRFYEDDRAHADVIGDPRRSEDLLPGYHDISFLFWVICWKGDLSITDKYLREILNGIRFLVTFSITKIFQDKLDILEILYTKSYIENLFLISLYVKRSTNPLHKSYPFLTPLYILIRHYG